MNTKIKLPSISTWLLSAFLFFVTCVCLYAAESSSSSASGASALQSSGLQMLIIVVVPSVIAGLKKLWPALPAPLIPWLCPALGYLADRVAALAGQDLGSTELSAAFGALGLYLRELYDQSKKALGDGRGGLGMIAIALMLSPGVAGAANLPRLTTADLAPSNYRAGEFSIDGFGTARLQRLSDLEYLGRVHYGGGIGGNWFPWRAAGFGIEGRTEDVRDSVFDQAGGKLIGRLPFHYFAMNFAIGAQFNCEPDKWDVFAEVGPEVRFTKHFGLFLNVRGVRPVEGPAAGLGEHVLGMLGARYVF